MKQTQVPQTDHVAACLRGQFCELLEGVTSCLVSPAGTGLHILQVILTLTEAMPGGLTDLKAGSVKGM